MNNGTCLNFSGNREVRKMTIPMTVNPTMMEILKTMIKEKN